MINFKNLEDLTNAELLELLNNADETIKYFEEVKKLALLKVQNGTTFDGWQLVAKSGVRKWEDEDQAVEIFRKAKALKNQYIEEKVITPTKAEKVFGANFYKEKLEQIIKAPTIYTLKKENLKND